MTWLQTLNTLEPLCSPDIPKSEKKMVMAMNKAVTLSVSHKDSLPEAVGLIWSWSLFSLL